MIDRVEIGKEGMGEKTKKQRPGDEEKSGGRQRGEIGGKEGRQEKGRRVSQMTEMARKKRDRDGEEGRRKKGRGRRGMGRECTERERKKREEADKAKTRGGKRRRKITIKE